MIRNIYWERTILWVQCDTGEGASLRLAGADRSYPFRVYAGESERAALCLSNVADGRFLESGTWTLARAKDVSSAVLEKLPELSRVFSYSAESHYIVSFVYDVERDQLLVNTQFVKKNPHPRRRRRKQELVRLGMQAIYRFWRLVTAGPGRRARTAFLSQTRDAASDNMKAVMDRMVERQLDRKYPITTLFRNTMKPGMNLGSQLALLRKLASADTLFIDDYMPCLSYVKLDRNVKLVQLWHAGVGYKLLGYARFGMDGSPHPYQSCHRQYTHAVIGNEHLKDIYAEVFGVNREVLLPTGMPRLEHFLDADVRQSACDGVLHRHPELAGKRVILFAPTFRGAGQKEAFYDYSHIDQEAIWRMCRETDSIFVFKWHHFIRQPMAIGPEYADRLVDYSEDDLNELMYVSDVLITDYSSCFYDYLLLERPILFYIFDEEAYSLTRGVHEPVHETAPGLICRTSAELIDALRQKTVPRVAPQPQMVDMCLTNGSYTASDRIIDAVFGEGKG